MEKKPVNWQALTLLLFAIAFIGWALLNGHNGLAALGASIVTILAYQVITFDPEIVEAERDIQKTQWRVLPLLAAFVFAGIFISDIEGFEWVRLWIILPGAILFSVWFFLIWPAIVAYRTDKKIKTRKQRVAE